MNKICTTIEQSKKLVELGLDVNTADMSYHPIMDIDIMDFTKYLDIPSVIPFSEVKNSKVAMLPAWSLSALLELIPKNYNLRNSNIGINKYNIWIPERKSPVWCSSPLDAAFEMVVWLKENKKI